MFDLGIIITSIGTLASVIAFQKWSFYSVMVSPKV